MESLPPELLLYIFQYLDSRELTSVAYVNKHWQDVVKRKCFWVNKVFVPPVHISTVELKQFLKTVPNLKHVRVEYPFEYPFEIERFVTYLCEFCKEIETFVTTTKCLLSDEDVRKLLKSYPQAKHIEAWVFGRFFLMDLVKFYSKSYRQQRMHISIVENVNYEDHSSSWHEFEEYPSKKCSIREFRSMVEDKKETTHYLMLDAVLSREIFFLIGKCRKLKQLFLENKESIINFDVFKHLKNLNKLESLQLFLGNFIPPTTISPEIMNFPNLVKLEMFSYSGIGGNNFLGNLLFSAPALKYLRIQSLDLRDRDLEATRNCRYLEAIAIPCNDHLTNTAVQHIATNCSKLKHIDLSCCKSLTERVIDLLSLCPDIEELVLQYFTISIPYLRKIPDLFPNIKVINLKHGSSDSKQALDVFESDFQNLKLVR